MTAERTSALEALETAARRYVDAVFRTDDLAARGALLGEIYDALARLDAAPADTEGGWRPIETAPKDGQEIVAVSNGARWIVSWHSYPPDSFALGGWRIKALPGRDPIAYIDATGWLPLSDARGDRGGRDE